MLKEELLKRNLPKLKNRDEMIKILLENEYGVLPNVDYKLTISPPEYFRRNHSPIVDCQHSKVDFTFSTDKSTHTFRVDRVLQTDGKKHPLFIFMNFGAEVPNWFYPTEEICERGFNILSFDLDSVTSDDDNFDDGLSKVLLPNGQETDTTAGKLMIWAFTCMRVLDYAETLDCIDLENVAVVGHSRLGKTALLTAMLDTRFKFAFSNDSGCSGAALARGNSGVLNFVQPRYINNEPTYKNGETIADITIRFGFFFCKNFFKYAKNNYPDDFDQHFLISSIAPRFCYVSSASKDYWADPNSEFFNCVASSVEYERLGLNGLVCDDKLPKVGDRFLKGRIGYHLREGEHYLSRHDWKNFMDYIDLHKNEKV